MSRVEPYLLAVDDGPFRRGERLTVLVGVLHDTSLVPWRIASRLASIDGSDATSLVIDIVGELGSRLVLVDSVTCCGFNFIDGERVWRETGSSVVHVYLYPLDINAIRRALEKAGLFDERFEVVKRHWSRSVRIDCRYGGFWATIWGDVEPGSLCALQLYSRVPTPLQNAHKLARVVWESLRSRLKPGGGAEE